MHNRVTDLYNQTCKDCEEHLTLDLSDVFKPFLTAVAKAIKALHKKGSYTTADLAKTPEYANLIIKTNGILSGALKDNDLSPKMLKALQEDLFIFSGLKTHAQLFEASRQLLKENKTLKSFDQFKKDVKGVSDSHRQYLEAEYNFATSSTQMAEKWDSFNDGDRYLLQYRTARDSKVREEHAELHDVTLPKNDSFWDSYFPPNGWNCRCTTVEVLKATNTVSNSKKAQNSGKKATTKIGKNGKNKLEIFRFNPGKEKVIFPKDHPYHKVAGASKVKGSIKKLKDE